MMSLGSELLVWAAWRFSPSSRALRHFKEGHGDALGNAARDRSVDVTGVGSHREALKLVDPAKEELDDEDRVVACEALRQLGRFDEALLHLRRPAMAVNVEARRRCCNVRVLVDLNRLEEARERLRPLNVNVLAREKCEVMLTTALVQLKEAALDDCEVSLHSASKTAELAPEKRDVEFAWAELWRARGDMPRALTHYQDAAKHTWRWQGGPGLLASRRGSRIFNRSQPRRFR